MAQKKIANIPRFTRPAVVATNKTINKPSNSSSNSNLEDISITSEISSISSIRSASSRASSINKFDDETNDKTLNSSSSTISHIGSISHSRSSSISSKTSRTATNSISKPKNETYSIKDNSDTAKNSTDLVKNIEEIVARNKILEEENLVLKNLIHEESGKKDSFDERRILMLKCQIYQLEKQIHILSKSLSFRKNAHTDALNSLTMFSDSFRSILHEAESRNSNSINCLTIDKNQFIKWVELAESCRIKLNKTEEEDLKNLSEPSLISSTFTKNNQEVNIIDICSGNLDYINLKQVSLLESNLASLFKKLTRLKESFQTVRNDKQSLKKNEKVNKIDEMSKKKHESFVPLHKENMKNQLDDCIKAIHESCTNLFELSLIVPSAPWSILKASPIEQLTQETLLLKLKSIGLAKVKYQSVEVLLKAYYVANNYHFHMKNLECLALNEEVNFYRSCHSIQKDYIESLMSLFRNKYEQFLSELKENLNEPLRILIEKFWSMKNESTEENLKDFLNYFKHYAKKFDLIIKNIENMPQNDLIGQTFNQLIQSLDTEVENLNKASFNNLDKIKLNKIDLNELSVQSDLLLSEIVKLTPDSSPTSSTNDFANNQ